MGLSARQVRRLCRAYEWHGPTGLASRKRGRPSNRRLPAEIQLRRCRLLPAVRQGPEGTHEGPESPRGPAWRGVPVNGQAAYGVCTPCLPHLATFGRDPWQARRVRNRRSFRQRDWRITHRRRPGRRIFLRCHGDISGRRRVNPRPSARHLWRLALGWRWRRLGLATARRNVWRRRARLADGLWRGNSCRIADGGHHSLLSLGGATEGREVVGRLSRPSASLLFEAFAPALQPVAS
ncbi:MAG: hypothetical protein ABIS92_17105 [Polyangia bacterium]